MQLQQRLTEKWQHAEWPLSLGGKCEQLASNLHSCPDVTVALSGGQDSAFMLIAAVILCERVKAVTIDSCLLPVGELDASRSLCSDLGIEHRVLNLDPLRIDAVRANASDRCYHCKKYLFTEIIREAGAGMVVDGTNVDDAADYRPGKTALQELEVVSPLSDAGFTKCDIAAALRILGMEGRIKPPSACLATRFPYDTALHVERLRCVGRLEQALRMRGFAQCRIRADDTTARIEVAAQDIPRLMETKMRTGIVALVKEAGFGYVVLDLEGYRTGSWNESLT